jgi:predicted ester cyclase
MHEASPGGIIQAYRMARGERKRVVLEENKVLVRRLIREVEKGTPDTIEDVLNEVLAPDFVDHDLRPDQEPDRESYKQDLSEDRAALSNLDITIEDQIAEGEKVVTRLTWRGTHDRGTFMGMAPTGKKIEVTAIFIHRIVEGKVMEEWSASDTLEKLR